VRTADALSRILRSGDSAVHFEVLSNPEFLAEGTAIADLTHPDRVLIGGADTTTAHAAVAELVELYAAWVPRERILTANIWSSELTKLAANAMLAQRVSSINALSALCEATEANVAEVARAIGMDARIGPKFLRAGVGFGGSCFHKDILNLVYLCESYGLTEVANFWRQVVVINNYQQNRFVATMVRAMFNTVAEKRIALLGFAFKADTGDTRESPANRIARLLVDEHARVVISDPRALDNARTDLASLGDHVLFEPDPYVAVAGADAVAFLTDWREYRELDFPRLLRSMRRPAFLFDGRSFLDHDALFRLGFNVHAIGRTPLSHLDN